jgi:hypothetical protein
MRSIAPAVREPGRGKRDESDVEFRWSSSKYVPGALGLAQRELGIMTRIP